MPKKKVEEVEETVAAAEETAVEETVVEAAAEETAVEETVVGAAVEEAAPVEEAPAAEEVAVETAPVAEEKPKKAAKAPKAEAKADVPAGEAKKVHKRAEKVGIVASDKMTNTVTVRVDRLVKHPIYRKYVKKRKKFMAHDDLGAKIGDRVKIVETRPLSARKRWRVVEIIQKAEL
jgi:small subunit ribosomal protein S17